MCDRKFHVKNGVKKGEFHANFTLLGRSAEKSSCPTNFLPAILGLEMAAPILWAPRISGFFLQENLHVHTIPRFGGGGNLGLGGGKYRFYFYGRGDFSDQGYLPLDRDGPHLNPVTMNPVIRMSCLGPFLLVRGMSEQFRARSPKPLVLKCRMGVRGSNPGTTPGRSTSPKSDIRPALI